MLHPTSRQQQLGSSRPENVGDVDRWISGTIGLSCLLSGLRRGGLGGLIHLGLGSALLYRGMTGHCPVQESIDADRAHAHGNPPAPAETIAGTQKKAHVRPASKEPPDRVDEASEESFPASDPPGWGPDRL